MSRTEVVCRSCLRNWTMPVASSVYAQQALESCPCPCCGAYTLSCVVGQPGLNRPKPSRFGLTAWAKDAFDSRPQGEVFRRLR
jgi:hypothetical protein